MKICGNYPSVMSVGEISYVKDGELHVGEKASVVMVESESNLTDLAGAVSPGSIAFTCGFVKAWQLNAAGEWVEFMPSEDDGTDAEEED